MYNCISHLPPVPCTPKLLCLYVLGSENPGGIHTSKLTIALGTLKLIINKIENNVTWLYVTPTHAGLNSISLF